MGRPRIRPWHDRHDQVEKALDAREDGATLRGAAEAAGVHVATLIRWAEKDPGLRKALDDAAYIAGRRLWAERLAAGRASTPRPRVETHPDCPWCGRAAEVPRTFWRAVFWRCSAWPRCPWASWRPRCLTDCPDCGEPRLWACSRKSVWCTGCEARTPVLRLE